MEFGNKNVRVRMERDRISSLPDEIIHHILSFNDTKYAVQTSVLSSRWRLIWTTLPYLKFGTDKFRILPKFSKCVNRVLSRRNNRTEISSIDLNFRGPVNQKFMQKIGDYAVTHNLQKVNIFAYQIKGNNDQQIPPCFFSSQSLKHLSIKTAPLMYNIYPLQQSPWDTPALTTIELKDVTLCAENTMSLDLFSKCVSLMNLTLIDCRAFRSKVMKISCPRLVHLTISRCEHFEYEILAPNLSSFFYKGRWIPLLSAGGLNSLEKVNLHTFINRFHQNNKVANEFMNRLYKLRNAKFLTLGGSIVELLSDAQDLLEYQASPFCNLKCLRIEVDEILQKRTKSDVISKVISYLLNSSPTATVIM